MAPDRQFQLRCSSLRDGVLRNGIGDRIATIGLGGRAGYVKTSSSRGKPCFCAGLVPCGLNTTRSPRLTSSGCRQLLWSIPYGEITSVQPRHSEHDVPMSVRTTREIHHIPVRELLKTSQQSYDYQSYHHEALLLMLNQRTRSEPAMAPDRAG